MIKRFVFTLIVMGLFVSSSHAAPIVKFFVGFNPTNNIFTLSVEDMVPFVQTEQEFLNGVGNGGIAGFSLTFTPNVAGLIINPGIRGEVDGPDVDLFGFPIVLGTGFSGSGTMANFNLAATQDIANSGTNPPTSELTYGFGQIDGVIRDNNGDKSFTKRHLIGLGQFTGAPEDFFNEFDILNAEVNVFTFNGSANAVGLADNEIEMVIPEPASAAILGAFGLFLLPRRRRIA